MNAQALLTLVAACLALAYGTLDCLAQSDAVDWSQPANLSSTPQVSAHAAIVTDLGEDVHVFWSEEVGGPVVRPQTGTTNTGNTILHTRFDGSEWTPPLDVLYVPGEVYADFPAVSAGPDNALHIVWMATSSLYYSKAPSWAADSAHGWDVPQEIANYNSGSLFGCSVAVDASGYVHVIYAANSLGAGVYYLQSRDRGTTWTSPLLISDPLGPLEVAYSVVRIVVDASNRVHAVWQTNEAEGFGQAIYHARSVNDGRSWEPCIQLGYRDPGDFEVSWPYIAALGDRRLHLVYVDGGGVGSHGRYYRTSSDGGGTWSSPQRILDEMLGINGYVIPVMDAAGVLHLVVNMRPFATQLPGIYYSRWASGSWSPVQALDVTVQASHWAAVTTRLGNEIHVVWTALRDSEIYHIQGIVASVEPQEAIAVPSAAGMAVSSPTPQAEQRSGNGELASYSATSSEPASAWSAEPELSEPSPLVVGGGLAFGLVIVAIGLSRARSGTGRRG